jgi:hypothetical protein
MARRLVGCLGLGLLLPVRAPRDVCPQSGDKRWSHTDKIPHRSPMDWDYWNSTVHHWNTTGYNWNTPGLSTSLLVTTGKPAVPALVGEGGGAQMHPSITRNMFFMQVSPPLPHDENPSYGPGQVLCRAYFWRRRYSTGHN